jgi:hypothetical protein
LTKIIPCTCMHATFTEGGCEKLSLLVGGIGLDRAVGCWHYGGHRYQQVSGKTRIEALVTRLNINSIFLILLLAAGGACQAREAPRAQRCKSLALSTHFTPVAVAGVEVPANVAGTPLLDRAVTGWDSGEIRSPVVLHDQLSPPAQRFMMWYAGAGTPEIAGSAAGVSGIGLAYSVDGLRFNRLAASASPYGKPGLVLTGADIFGGEPAVASVSLGDLRVTNNRKGYDMWFSKIGFDEPGKVAAAGVTHAVSIDGVHWSIDAKDVLTLRFASSQVSLTSLRQRLHDLTLACAETGDTDPR